MPDDWKSCRDEPPMDGFAVLTKIDDEGGIRNEQPLKRHRGLWYFPDDSMYVYYSPTHWKPLPRKDA